MCDNCSDCYRQTVFIEIADGITAEVTFDQVEYYAAEENSNLLDLKVVGLMMTTKKLDELIEQI